MKKIVLLTVFAYTGVFLHAQKHDLRLNLEIGKTYHQRTEADITIRQLIEGQSMDMTMQVDGQVAFIVTAKEGNQYLMDVHYEEITMGTVMEGQSTVYSSASIDTSDLVSVVLGAMTGNPFQIKLSDKGRVTEIRNINSWVEPARKQMTHFPQEMVDQVLKEVQKTYGEDALRGNIELASAIFPDKPVAVGESWSVPTRLNGTVKADIVTQYTLVSHEKDQTVILGAADVASDKKAAPMEMAMGTVQYDLKGTITSEIKLDKSTGWVTSGTYSQTLKGENIITTTFTPEPMKVPMELVSKMTLDDRKD